MLWCDIDLTIDLAVVTLSLKIIQDNISKT